MIACAGQRGPRNTGGGPDIIQTLALARDERHGCPRLDNTKLPPSRRGDLGVARARERLPLLGLLTAEAAAERAGSGFALLPTPYGKSWNGSAHCTTKQRLLRMVHLLRWRRPVLTKFNSWKERRQGVHRRESPMSLRVPRPYVSLLLVALLAAVVNAACGSDSMSTVAPSPLAVTAGAGAGGGGRFTTYDDPPLPTPAPVVTPTPGPDPATNPGPWPAIPSLRPVVWTPTPDSNDYFNVSVDLNPVPFSGQPVPVASCSALPHTWFYRTLISSRTGNAFRIVARENYFDGYLSSSPAADIALPAQQRTEVNTRWCSGYGKAHTAQHRFRVLDNEGRELILNGPVVQLQQNPHWVPPPPAPVAAPQRLLENPLLVWGD